MEKLLFGYCGLNCSECPVFIATVNNDEELRISTAKEWTALYSEYLGQDELKSEDIDCLGCSNEDGVNFIGCVNYPIRECSRKKGFDTCAICDDYESCGMLNGFFSQFPQAKTNLDTIRLR